MTELAVRPIAPATTVDVVVPVYNEAHVLEASITRLHAYLAGTFPFPSVITIADNASTDGTAAVAERLVRELDGVRVVHLTEKGRGRALRAAWGGSDADVVAYMDVDLSTDLDALLPLVAPLVSGHSDLAIGSRLASGANVVRGAKRELISRTYNAILRLALRNRFTDAQCGFKAMRAEDARVLLPAVADQEWFFDTELLVLAERHGLRIHEVPVDWVDDPDSRVRIARTAIADLRGVARLLGREGAGEIPALAERHGRQDSELSRFARVGAASTVAHLVGFVALRPALGTYGANALALACCAAANTAVHLRYTFRRRGAVGSSTLRWTVGLVGVSLGLTTAALAIAGAVTTTTTGAAVALLLGNALAALVRFVVLRAVAFHAHLAAAPAAGDLSGQPSVQTAKEQS